MSASDFIQLARAVIDNEARAIDAMQQRLDDEFNKACEYMLGCKGRIIVIGMGKSGHIGGKIASTLASTGTPAFFVHPGEAAHGDFGMITTEDVILAISNSGETDELLTLLPLLKRQGNHLIALTGKPQSSLARAASAHIFVGVEEEACPLGLAPTTSTTVALVMGDALAIALLDARGFSAEDFARSHPAGRLGRRLLLHISDIMHGGADIPSVPRDATLKDALLEISAKRLGMTAITDTDRCILGIFTDGDLRRCLDRDIDISSTRIADVMSTSAKTIEETALAEEALLMMQRHQISGLLVTNADAQLSGALNMHDLLRAGVV